MTPDARISLGGARAVPGPRPLRGPQAGRARSSRRLGLLEKVETAPPRRGPLLPLRHGGRAAALRPVVRPDGAARRARARGLPRRHAAASSPSAGATSTPQWMEGIRDWCISRQLWWGHRIPVWYCEAGAAATSTRQPRPTSTACPACGGAGAPGRGRARHLVLLLAGAVLEPGLARAHAATSPASTPGTPW